MRLLRTAILAGMLVLPTGLAFATYEDGLKAYNSGDFKQAATLWEELAIAGNVNAQYNLGVIHEQGGEDQPKDLALAYAWYRLAASQEMPEALQAVSRLKELLTTGQIEDGNKYAVTVLGKWYRQSVGMSDDEFKKIIEARAAREKAKIEAENRQAAERVQRQRALIAQRDADAKLAKKLEEQSRQDALKAAREQAEEAKRKAYLAQKQREEEERMARLREQKKEQDARQSVLQRLAELKAKQQGNLPSASAADQLNPGQSKSIEAVPAQPKSTPAPEKAQPQKAPKSSSDSSQTKATVVQPKVIEPVTQRPKPTEVQTIEPKAASAQPVKQSSAPTVVAKSVAEPLAPEKSAAQNQVEKPEPEQVIKEETAPLKKEGQEPEKVAALPKQSSKPDVPTTTMPVIANGLDQSVVAQILQAAQSVSLNTPSAKDQIEAKRNDIEALKWSLISSARGKAGAKDMNQRLMDNMSDVQIAEANRRAADWILKRQARQ